MAWLAHVLGALLYIGFGVNRVKRRARLRADCDTFDRVEHFLVIREFLEWLTHCGLALDRMTGATKQ
jgi:hypothetical protein